MQRMSASLYIECGHGYVTLRWPPATQQPTAILRVTYYIKTVPSGLRYAPQFAVPKLVGQATILFILQIVC